MLKKLKEKRVSYLTLVIIWLVIAVLVEITK